MNTRGLTELGMLLFLDRYSKKCGTRETLKVGDTVLVQIDGQKIIGEVSALPLATSNSSIIIHTATANSEYLEFPIEAIDKPLELDPAEMWQRVAQAVAEAEQTSEKFEEWHDKFKWLLDDWKFLPGGRILAAAGTDTELTYYNCYVIPSPKDSKDEIFKTLNVMAQIMAVGGGVGMNISSLRPRYSHAKRTNGRSSGAVSWGELYSYATGLIEQGGCVIGNTLIATAGGNVPIKDLVGTNPWVYSYDLSKRCVVMKQASWVAKTGINKPVYKLHTDKGLDLYATGDHKILMRDGTYNELINLKPNMRIMPLARYLTRGQVTVRTVLGDTSKPEVRKGIVTNHRFVYEQVHNVKLTTNDHIHHIDRNHYNDDPTNLQRLSSSEHARLHGKESTTLAEYFATLPREEIVKRSKAGNKKLREVLDGSYGEERMLAAKHGLSKHIKQLNIENNPMKTESGKLACIRTKSINGAYKLLNAGFDISTSQLWDEAMYKNRITSGGVKYGIGFTNSFPRSKHIIQAFGSYEHFHAELLTMNHRVESVEFSHYDDVYDMEIPGTNNFAVVNNIYPAACGIFIHNSRRGALMLILDDWHPDIIEFINVKKDMKRITNANISVGLSDKFMKAVELDDEWELKFPDTTHASYDAEWNGDLHNWMSKGYPVKIWKTIRARDLWQSIIESAWSSAEPGIWFKDRANSYSNSQYYAPLIATNPCAEEPLPEWSVCLLGSINLSKFVSMDSDGNWNIDWDDLEIAVHYAVRFLDNVIDVTPYIYPEMEEVQKSERRIGLGTMGLAEVLIRMQLRYGSDDSIKFIDNLYRFITVSAYEESIMLAKEKGKFPKFSNQIVVSRFIQNLPYSITDAISEYGLRNVTLITQAPTGTIGTLVNTSTGIEPFYYWEYERKGRFGSHTERVKVYDEWASNFGELADRVHEFTNLPDYFVTAQDLTPEEHVKVQAAIQRWVDSSISKTCNVPEDYTVEQVGELYKLMYELGCKGGTIYRNHSRNEQVLNLKTVTTAKPTEESHKEMIVKKRPDIVSGRTHKKITHAGTAFITVNEDNDKHPFEVFINIGRAGSDVACDAEAIGRLVSTVFRTSNGNVMACITEIVAQLKGIGGNKSVGFGNSRVSSVADALAQVLEQGYLIKEESNTANHNNITGELCSSCGNYSILNIEGCSKCIQCGYSKC